MSLALETAKQIVELVDSDEVKNRETELVKLLTKIAYEIPNTDFHDEFDGLEIPENDYPAIRSRIEQNFPSWGMYNFVEHVTTNIGNTRITVGDAIDDLTDIVNDLKMVLWSLEHENMNAANWHLVDSYTNHWREHLLGILLYTHFDHIEV